MRYGRNISDEVRYGRNVSDEVRYGGGGGRGATFSNDPYWRIPILNACPYVFSQKIRCQNTYIHKRTVAIHRGRGNL